MPNLDARVQEPSAETALGCEETASLEIAPGARCQHPLSKAGEAHHSCADGEALESFDVGNVVALGLFSIAYTL